jgi:hypothetical protein
MSNTDKKEALAQKQAQAHIDNLNAQTRLLLAQAEELEIRNRREAPRGRRARA